ncbi:uncharacterized protein PODANS_6_11110 [Podospora anserina S mat+]|uniref:Dimethylaniline monooxygenase n=1 Tax=Podospora anserina (strain S / ATCC MYA-4624 / DSM 980 / FGSC 10383) TaxID=515849 RepID=B2ANK2_PODAN|nr:uncharacterized protein PODANS_6_11110 [Podospora anserina S mat+]CAP65622.1 unnamed protein product [Podospora anserina S mat+]CDP31616.1 Putative Dimethylaniline monooxygenase [Podospora anserina S mat+]
MRVAVIGAGPSGLVTLKYLLSACDSLGSDPVEPILFESESLMGGTFVHRTYEDGELVSSKQLTTFSDFRPQDSDPDFHSTDRYVEYLNDYCTHFGLWEHIKLSITVVSIRKNGNRRHIITYRQQDGPQTAEHECDAVAIFFHSSEFKNRSQFGVGKTVLILGSGETAMDLGYLAMHSPIKRGLMSHRDGFLCAPKRVPDPVILPILGNKPDPNRLNVPVDSGSASLFDTAYVHRRMRDQMLLWHYYDIFIQSTLWLVGGSKYGMAQWIGGISDERYHAIFFNKSNKAMPYLSAPYRQERESSIVQRIRSSLIQVPIAETGGRHIDLAPWPTHFDEQGIVHFRSNNRPEFHRLKGQRIKPDVVIFATGYTQTFPFFSDDHPTPESLDTRSIWKSTDPSVAFIGFIRPSFGAIPPLSKLQAQLWVVNLLRPGLVPRPLSITDEPHYKLKMNNRSRIQYGVDHESYAYQLALDMGAASGFSQVLSRGWAYQTSKGRRNGGWYKLPLVWALGANFNTKFRLTGLWKWKGAEHVLVEELWATVERRGGFFGHVTLSGLPMDVFGCISLVLWVLEPVMNILGMLM